MPESEGSPRRAWLSDADTSSPPDTDPTPADDIFRPRRGSTDDAAAFSRPDSDEPQGETPIPAPVFPRSAGEVADSPSPAPRRSALSSSTPLEAETPAPPPRTQPARPGLAVWALGGLVGALAVGMIAFYASRGAEPATSQSGSAAASASASPTVVAAPEDLVTGEDLAGIAAAASWSVTHTSTAAADHEGRVACLSTQTEDQNPTSSLQRTLATSDEDQLAALHRIETYASPGRGAAGVRQPQHRAVQLRRDPGPDRPGDLGRGDGRRGLPDLGGIRGRAHPVPHAAHDTRGQRHPVAGSGPDERPRRTAPRGRGPRPPAGDPVHHRGRHLRPGAHGRRGSGAGGRARRMADSLGPPPDPARVRPVDGLGPHRPHERRDGVREPDSGE